MYKYDTYSRLPLHCTLCYVQQNATSLYIVLHRANCHFTVHSVMYSKLPLHCTQYYVHQALSALYIVLCTADCHFTFSQYLCNVTLIVFSQYMCVGPEFLTLKFSIQTFLVWYHISFSTVADSTALPVTCHDGTEQQSQSFSIDITLFVLSGGGWSPSCHDCFTLEKGPWYALFMTLGGSQDKSGWMWGRENPFPLLGFEP
jgi:hypothetical protein